MLTFIATLLLTQAPETTPTAAEKQVIAEAGLTETVVAKLSADQLHDVLRHQKPGNEADIAVVAVIGSYLAAVLIVIAVVAGILRAAQQRGQTLRLMVEKGVQIPPELIAPPPRPQSDLRRGVILASFGIGLGVFLMTVPGLRPMWTLGLVPLFVGIGYLISSRLAKSEASAVPTAG